MLRWPVAKPMNPFEEAIFFCLSILPPYQETRLLNAIGQTNKQTMQLYFQDKMCWYIGSNAPMVSNASLFTGVLWKLISSPPALLQPNNVPGHLRHLRLQPRWSRFSFPTPPSLTVWSTCPRCPNIILQWRSICSAHFTHCTYCNLNLAHRPRHTDIRHAQTIKASPFRQLLYISHILLESQTWTLLLEDLVFP